MGKLKLLALPLILAATLSACAVPGADDVSNPLQDMIDTIPWARDVADTASARELTARVDEISATLGSLEVSEAVRSQIEARLTALGAQLATNPSQTPAHVDELRDIIADIAAAVESGP